MPDNRDSSFIPALDLGVITPAERFINIEHGIGTLNDKFDMLYENLHKLELRVVAIACTASGLISLTFFLASKLWK